MAEIIIEPNQVQLEFQILNKRSKRIISNYIVMCKSIDDAKVAIENDISEGASLNDPRKEYAHFVVKNYYYNPIGRYYFAGDTIYEKDYYGNPSTFNYGNPYGK